MKKPEILELAHHSPDLYERAIQLGRGFRQGKHLRGDDPRAVQGLGIRFSWQDVSEPGQAGS